MSVDILIRQKKIFKNKLDLAFLQKLCGEQGLQYGVPNQALVLDEYQGGADIAGTVFSVYDPKRIGRGFSFEVAENRQDCKLYLNIPCTAEDVASCYRFVQNAAGALGAKKIEQDGNAYPVAELSGYRDDVARWNQSVLHEFAGRSAGEDGPMTVFGAVYPVTPDLAFYQKLLALAPGEAVRCYGEYLHETQNHDYYYAKPSFFKIDGVVTGMYALTQDVPSVFPLQPEIPVFSGTGLKKEDVGRWLVRFGAIRENGGGFDDLGQLDFGVFAEKIDLAAKPRFDGRHVVIELAQKDLSGLFG